MEETANRVGMAAGTKRPRMITPLTTSPISLYQGRQGRAASRRPVASDQRPVKGDPSVYCPRQACQRQASSGSTLRSDRASGCRRKCRRVERSNSLRVGGRRLREGERVPPRPDGVSGSAGFVLARCGDPFGKPATGRKAQGRPEGLEGREGGQAHQRRGRNPCNPFRVSELA